MNKSVRWPNAHIKLRELYDARAPKEMTQADFGKAYGIGTQSMVWQYLSGSRPLNIEVTAKFARALRVTIRDISPEMADALEADIVPMLGERALKRAVAKMAVVLAAWIAIPPTQVHAAWERFDITLTEYTLRAISTMRRWLRARFVRSSIIPDA